MFTVEKRREFILKLIKNSSSPLSGKVLGDKTGVTRQVIVQDIALLRAEGHNIISTAKGYLIVKPKVVTRVFKVKHSIDEIEDELTTIVDLGGHIIDITVNHRIYNKISAVLNIKNRRDIKKFLENLNSGKSSALSIVTSGYHYHSINAENEEILNEIEEALRQKNYLV